MGKPANLKKRYEVAALLEHHPERSLKSIARATNVSPSFVGKVLKIVKATGDVVPQPRKAPQRKLTEAVKKKIIMIADSGKSFSAQAIAVKLLAEEGLRVCSRSVQRVLKDASFDYVADKTTTSLTDKQMKKRVKFATSHKRTTWNSVLFTDSKIFWMRASPTQKSWQRKGMRRSSPGKRHAAKVHVYAGVCAYGKIGIYAVTGTSGIISKFINPKTGLPQSGVCGLEYKELLELKMLPDAEKLFANSRTPNSWTFQQDGATVHRTKAALELLKENCPKFIALDWPANSPDLSPIENIWGWMQRQINKEPLSFTLEDFKLQIQGVWDRVPATMLKNLAAGMKKRMEKVTELKGAHIGR
jgi:transposase